MKSYGLVIDQALQPPQNYHLLPSITAPSTQVFPVKLVSNNNTQSYSTVVEQAIITKDKPLLKEIIADSDELTLRNTIGSISVDKISSLLTLLEQFLYDDSRHTDHYCRWLKQLLRQHMGIILSNSENKSIVSRLIKFVQRKTSERASILHIRSSLLTQAVPQKARQFRAKFNYIQNQQRNNQQQLNQNMEVEQFDQEEEMLDDYDD